MDRKLRQKVLHNLFKAFDCVPHDLLLAKLAAYGVNESFLCYVYPYLLNWKQYLRINNIIATSKCCFKCLTRIYGWADYEVKFFAGH